jgi:hypothetical protein
MLGKSCIGNFSGIGAKSCTKCYIKGDPSGTGPWHRHPGDLYRVARAVARGETQNISAATVASSAKALLKNAEGKTWPVELEEIGGRVFLSTGWSKSL